MPHCTRPHQTPFLISTCTNRCERRLWLSLIGIKTLAQNVCPNCGRLATKYSPHLRNKHIALITATKVSERSTRTGPAVDSCTQRMYAPASVACDREQPPAMRSISLGYRMINTNNTAKRNVEQRIATLHMHGVIPKTAAE